MLRAPCKPSETVTASRTTACADRKEPQVTAPRAYRILESHANGPAALAVRRSSPSHPRDGGALLRSPWPPLSHRRSQSLLFLARTERPAIFGPCTSVLGRKAAGNRPSCEMVLAHQSPGLLPGLS